MTARSRLFQTTSLVAGTIWIAASLAAPAAAQSTEPTTGPGRVVTTETQGQAAPSTRVEGNAGGIAAPGDNGTTVGEVVVTGSRISRRDYVADSPVVSVGPKAIENTGAATLDRLIKEVPQFAGNLGEQSNNPGNGQLNLSLRGLGGTRTLVLVDGRRTTPSNVSGVIDINSIPQALIENIEVITGGQSTAYGSDAVAGVANFKLKHNFQGAVIDASYGISDHSDGEEQNVAVTLGGNFADDKGNAVISLGYSNRDPVFYGARADVTAIGVPKAGVNQVLAVSGASSTIPQGVATFFAANLPTTARVDTVFAKYGIAAGTVRDPNSKNPAASSVNFGFNQDGTLFNGPANYKGPTTIDYSTIPLSGIGASAGSYNTGALNYITTPLTRYNAFSTVEYAITPHIKAYGQFSFTNTSATTELAPSPASGNPATGGTGFVVPATNPFIPADLKSILNSRADPNAPFLLNKRFTDVGPRIGNFDNTTYQTLVGVKGDAPGRDLTYDIYASYGHFDSITTQSGNISHANLRTLLESPTGGNGSCLNGYNPFGVNSLSADCRAYISPTTKNQTTFTQRIVEGDFQGHLFTLPTLMEGVGGGDVRFAFGADYRDDRASFLPDALLSSQDVSNNVINGFTLANNTTGVIGFNGGQPITGDIDVYEAYGELLLPVLKDLPFAKSLNLDLGYRFSDYSTIGPAYTYKATLEWRMFDWLLLRGGYSRAIRAPNVADLFTPAANGFFDIGAAAATSIGAGDPCDVRGGYRKGVGGVNAASVRALCLAQGVPVQLIDSYTFTNTQVQELAGGNPNLQQERANTYSGGFVLQPHFSNPLFARLTASVDYYNIEVNGFINAVTPSTQVSKCFNADGSNPTYANTNLCTLFTRDPATGQIVSGQANLVNLGAVRTSGIDVQVDWSFALSTLPMLNIPDRFGSLSFNLVANWLNDYDLQVLPGDKFQNFRDSIASGPAGDATNLPGGDFPVWKAFMNVGYSVGPFDFGVSERYIGSARDAGCVGQTSVCTLRGADPTFYTDLNARWKINDTLELRGGITNVTAQDPRFFQNGSASQGNTDVSTYDLIGRRYFVAMKARF